MFILLYYLLDLMFIRASDAFQKTATGLKAQLHKFLQDQEVLDMLSTVLLIVVLLKGKYFSYMQTNHLMTKIFLYNTHPVVQVLWWK